jgi:hypothetical protein
MKKSRFALVCAVASIALLFDGMARASITAIDPALGDLSGRLGIDDEALVNYFDIDLLAEAAANASTNPIFDLNGDGHVTFAIGGLGSLDEHDSDVLIRDILETEYGDANLDGRVFFGDLAILAANWRQTGSLVGWSDGNFDGSQQVGTMPPRIFFGDLITLAAGWRFTDTSGNVDSADRLFDADGNGAIEVQHNPEPVSWQVWLVGMLCAYGIKHRRAKRTVL